MSEVNGQTKLVDVPILPVLSANITLPPKIDYNEKVGGNRITRLYGSKHLKNVEIFSTDSKSAYRAKLGNGMSFYILMSKSQKDYGESGTLYAEDTTDIKQLNKNTILKWVHFKIDLEEDPDKIAESWTNKLLFKQEVVATSEKGLRKPQLGAIHAISSHWSVRNDCGTIVMPTGTGKTDTMLSVLVNSQCRKSLVVVPSNALRKQLHGKFLELGKLRDIGVIHEDLLSPKVAMIKHGIKTKVEAKELVSKSNVLITTAAALKNSSDEVLSEITNNCTHLFIDEAHHTPASSWKRIKDAFGGKPVLQFTATPFRRDSKPIEGQILYNYPLGLAQKEGYFKKINLIKLQEFDDQVSDRAIAEHAVEALKKDLADGLNHTLMARCKSKQRAEDIIKIYEEIAPELNPKKVDSEQTMKEHAETESLLRSGGIRIIVCVNMLGEGFDLPSLKVAAIHDSHKSLAVTLQFVGRFTRLEHDVGEATVVVNVNEPQVNKDLEDLYSDNPDWNELLKEKSESTIETEIESHEFIGQFSGELSEHVSLWNLRPSFSTLVYETSCTSWKPEEFVRCLPEKYKRWHSINETKRVLVFVISKDDEVKWGRYKDILNHSFELCVLFWDEEKGAVYIQCSDYGAIDTLKLAKLVCGESTEVKNGSQVFNIYSGTERLLARNLGVSTLGNISYTMHFGSDVTTGMSSIDRAESSLNNVYAWGYENGDRFDGGCSSKSGKIWSVGGGPIIHWLDWCKKVGEKVFDDALPDNEILKDFLKPSKIDERYSSVALSVQWSENILKARESNVAIFIGANEYKLYEVDIEIVQYSDSGDILLRIFSDSEETRYSLSYSETGCSYIKNSGNDVYIRRNSRQPEKLEEYVLKDPIVIFYADGSYSWNNFHVPTPALNNFFDLARLRPIDWSGVDKKKESMGKNRSSNTVQHRAYQEIADDYEVVFDDDNSGEAADLIAIRKDDNNTLRVRLVHCKATKTKYTGSRVNDFYELCGQAQKSIRWKHNGFEYLCEHMKRRNESWLASGNDRFLKGDLATLNKLRRFARYAPKFVFEVTLVQPGLDSTKVSEDVIQLLGSTEDYLLKTSNAVFEVICA